MLYYTIYKTTNKLNGKIYIGAHKTKNLDDGYLGSGLHLGRSIKKYGVENFEKEILAVFDNKKDMFEMESVLVNEDFVEDKSTYNLKLGGQGGFDHLNDGSPEHIARCIKCGNKSKFKNALVKQKWLRENDQEWFKKRIQRCNESRIKYFQNHDGTFKGKKHTEETKRKIGDANSKSNKGSKNPHYGTMWISNIELKESKRIKKTESIPEGWVKGRNKWNRIRNCELCGIEFINLESNTVFCSLNCFDINLRNTNICINDNPSKKEEIKTKISEAKKGNTKIHNKGKKCIITNSGKRKYISDQN